MENLNFVLLLFDLRILNINCGSLKVFFFILTPIFQIDLKEEDKFNFSFYLSGQYYFFKA